MTSDAYAAAVELDAAAETVTVPAAVETFVRHLVVAWRAVQLYPASSAIPRTNIGVAIDSLRTAIAEEPALVLGITKTGVTFCDTPMFPGHKSYEAFARELYTRNLAELTFRPEADVRAMSVLLGVLREEQPDAELGSLVERLAAQGVDSISVAETKVALIEAPIGGLAEMSIEAAVADVLAGGTEGQRVLQLMIGDVDQVTAYVLGDGDDVERSASRVADLATIACAWPGDDGSEFLRTVAASIEGVPIDQRRFLLADHLLPQAKSDAAVASVMREMYLTTLFDSLIREEPKTLAERDGLARAIKNLSLISSGDRSATLDRAGQAMRDAGFSEETITDVLASATPPRIMLSDDPADADDEDKPVDTILQMIGLATAHDAPNEDEALAGLRTEAEKGVTDGDIVATLVSLVTISPSGPHFDITMRLIDESMPLLIERGEFSVASDATVSLAEAASRADVPPENAARMNAAIEQLVRPDNVRALLHAARRLREDDADRAAAIGILGIFGDRALDPLLDVLADESDRTVRKQLVELLSELAGDYVQEIARHLSDPRWYFVRNVVAVLGAAKRSNALPYLQRTIRHPEARVRRETIRAVAGLNERMSLELLNAALDDDDAQNVQLALHSLAMRSPAEAIPALARVARGEGRGNRDFVVRAEAVEALGKLGRPEALPTLEQLAGKRGLAMMGGRQRELRAAADAAIARIRVGGGS